MPRLPPLPAQRETLLFDLWHGLLLPNACLFGNKRVPLIKRPNANTASTFIDSANKTIQDRAIANLNKLILNPA